MKNIIPVILILASIGIFFGYIKPQFKESGALRQEHAIYKETLKNADKLELGIKTQQDQLSLLDPKDMAKLETMIPKKIDTIGLIINVDDIASNYGLKIRGIELDEGAEEAKKSATKQSDSTLYDSIDFSFTVTSSYSNFVNFMMGIEKSTRLMDVVKVSFAPAERDQYDFNITLRTYWLK